MFKPGTGFKKFFFAETGDTTLTTEAGTPYGGFGAIQELTQDPKSDKGTLRLFYQSDKTPLELRQRHVLRQDAR